MTLKSFVFISVSGQNLFSFTRLMDFSYCQRPGLLGLSSYLMQRLLTPCALRGAVILVSCIPSIISGVELPLVCMCTQ